MTTKQQLLYDLHFLHLHFAVTVILGYVKVRIVWSWSKFISSSAENKKHQTWVGEDSLINIV